jgi:hypothetical protein
MEAAAAAAAVARRRPSGLEDMPQDILEHMCQHFLAPASYVALLCTSRTLHAALLPSAFAWQYYVVRRYRRRCRRALLARRQRSGFAGQ